MLPIISVLAEKTLLKTTYHFLLLLIGFDTLTYRKYYDSSLHLWVISTQSLVHLVPKLRGKLCPSI